MSETPPDDVADHLRPDYLRGAVGPNADYKAASRLVPAHSPLWNAIEGPLLADRETAIARLLTKGLEEREADFIRGRIDQIDKILSIATVYRFRKTDRPI